MYGTGNETLQSSLNKVRKNWRVVKVETVDNSRAFKIKSADNPNGFTGAYRGRDAITLYFADHKITLPLSTVWIVEMEA